MKASTARLMAASALAKPLLPAARCADAPLQHVLFPFASGRSQPAVRTRRERQGAAVYVCVVLCGITLGLTPPCRAQDGREFVPADRPAASVDLGTAEGVKLVAGEWRYSDTKIIEVEFVAPDKTPGKTYDYTPHAGAADFDDSKWETLDPATLKKPRSTGKLCFNWYRINVTIPERIGEFATRGADVAFEVTIDDYAEVWVDGKLPRAIGQSGGSVIKGFNTANRLVVAKNVVPGQRIELAVFGINGPLSAAPDNYIFLRTSPRLDFFKGP